MAFWKMGIDCDGLLAGTLTKLEGSSKKNDWCYFDLGIARMINNVGQRRSQFLASAIFSNFLQYL